jgi:ADP-ribosyl-[dinitrogen reductase] hydrolase
MQPTIITALATGDALGKPFENVKGIDRERHAWCHNPDGTFLPVTDDTRAEEYGLGEDGRKAGAWTDDTQMAVALAQSLIACNGYSAADAFERYQAWYRGEGFGGRARGTGGTIRKALETGVPVSMREGCQYVGNGTAMRVAPIGVWYRNNMNGLVAAARADARLTHDSPEAEAGSVAVAVAIAVGTRRAEHSIPFGAAVWREVLTVLEAQSSKYAGLKFTAVYAAIKHAHSLANLRSSAPVSMKSFGDGGYVVDTVATAMLAGNRSDDFDECVCDAIEHGGDTDTRAAIAAAIRMARGDEAIPDRWRNVEKRDELLAIDERLWRRP